MAVPDEGGARDLAEDELAAVAEAVRAHLPRRPLVALDDSFEDLHVL